MNRALSISITALLLATAAFAVLETWVEIRAHRASGSFDNVAPPGQQGSLDGVLRTAEAFAALGGREVVEQGVRIAEGLATQRRDGQASERVRTFRERAVPRLTGTDGSRSDTL